RVCFKPCAGEGAWLSWPREAQDRLQRSFRRTCLVIDGNVMCDDRTLYMRGCINLRRMLLAVFFEPLQRGAFSGIVARLKVCGSDVLLEQLLCIVRSNREWLLRLAGPGEQLPSHRPFWPKQATRTQAHSVFKSQRSGAETERSKYRLPGSVGCRLCRLAINR